MLKFREGGISWHRKLLDHVSWPAPQPVARTERSAVREAPIVEPEFGISSVPNPGYACWT